MSTGNSAYLDRFTAARKWRYIQLDLLANICFIQTSVIDSDILKAWYTCHITPNYHNYIFTIYAL